MYVFECVGNDCISSAIVYDSGDLFVQQDWQGNHPEKLEEIENFDWIHESGKTGIILNGFPRIFA